MHGGNSDYPIHGNPPQRFSDENILREIVHDPRLHIVNSLEMEEEN